MGKRLRRKHSRNLKRGEEYRFGHFTIRVDRKRRHDSDYRVTITEDGQCGCFAIDEAPPAKK